MYYLKFKLNKIQILCESLKGIVHFEIKIWYLSAYPKGIQDVGVFFSSVDPILMLVSCLRPSMCSYDGELFNLDFSMHVLFPSYRDSDLYLSLYD